jgi:hypothetical protein
MAAWFRKKESGAADVPKAWRAALDEVLEGLSRGPEDLPREIRSYVLTGEPVSCLAKVATCDDAPRVLGASTWGRPASATANGRLYAALPGVPTEVLLRWARVLEPAVLGNRWTVDLEEIDGRRTIEALLRAVATTNRVAADRQVREALTHRVLEDLLAADGSPRSALLERAFGPSPTYRSTLGDVRTLLMVLPDYDEAVRRHAEEVRAAIARTKAATVLFVVELLSGLSAQTRELFAAELTDIATSSSARAREAATPMVVNGGPAMTGPLRERATDGKPEQRLHALRLLRSLATTDEDRAWTEATAAADRASSVVALVEEWSSAAAADDAPEAVVDTEPRPVVDWTVSVTPTLRQLFATFRQQTADATVKANAQLARQAELWQARHGTAPGWMRPQPVLAQDEVDDLLRRVAAGRPPQAGSTKGRHPLSHTGTAFMPELARHPEVTLAVLAHLFHHFGMLVQHDGTMDSAAAGCFNARHAALGSPTLSELAVLYDDMGLDGARAVLRRHCASWGEVLGQDWPRQAVAPFVADHLDEVSASIGRQSDWYVDESATYRAIATLSTLPRPLVERLFPVALTGLKAHRGPAQEALARLPERDRRVATALSDGKAEVRVEAARWIGREHIASALPALEQALAKEKQDVAKGAILDALEALGKPAEDYLDRDTLAVEAEKVVAKGLPKDLDWFPWSALPQARWADTGEPVALTTLQALLAQAVKAKSPEPNAILRRYCAMFVAADRVRLGQFVLDTWIAKDLEPVDRETAEAAARTQAGWTHQWMQRNPAHFQDDPLLGLTQEQIAAHYLPAQLRQPRGSATTTKGLLAVAAACAGEGAAASASRYLQEWYGMRAAQGKALIGMLAWVDHPSATQLMLSVGSRFRTKSFQDEATRQAAAMAERKGWTLSELADRTIPTGGLDESGVLQLPYGERVFTATLLPDLTLELRNPEGKKTASLPTPRKTDDEDRAKESKKALAAGRKEVKAVVKLQGERLYEALCTDRDWSFEDWDRYLNRHPLMHLLVQRLVWVATPEPSAGGGDGVDATRLFRPLDDFTLTDLDDDEVTLAASDRVRLAHDTNLPADVVTAWQEHLADYEVSPLFQQFGKGTFTLGEDLRKDKELTDFRGCLVEAFKLRGRATRLGYTRGSTEDGGWFHSYEKRFPTLGLSTRIEFSGNSLPEENRTVALTGLGFQRHSEGGQTSAMLLGDVPAVLLSEAYNDLRVLAGEGSGPDPDWEKKVLL